MPHLAIVGGSVVGSATALLFGRSGWRVTLVDPDFTSLADPTEPVRVRPGSPQAVHAHGFMSRAHHELHTRLPDVLDRLVDDGAPQVPLSGLLPPFLYDGGRPGDEQLTALRTRRVALDRVLARAVATQPGVQRVTGRASGLAVEDGVPPLVRAVVLQDGTRIDADLVVDAGGRRSQVINWLRASGVELAERVDPCVARYYTRHYVVTTVDPPPLNRGFLAAYDFPSLSQFCFLGDNRTAMLAQAVHDDDPQLKALRHPEAFDAIVAANRDFADVWAVLSPTTEVFSLGSFANRMRSAVVGGVPVVRGLVQVGDALAAANPTRGRGISMGLAAAGRLHDLAVGDGLGGADLVAAYGAWCDTVLGVYYREIVASDLAVNARLRGGLVGEAVPANAPGVELPDGHPVTAAELDRAAGMDPDLFRYLIRAAMLMDDERAIASRWVADRTRELLRDAAAEEEPAPATDGLHDRATLAGLLAAYL